MPRIYLERLTVDAQSIDMNGHVNNQDYIHWMQHVATAHSQHQGWPLTRYFESGTTWVIRSHFIEYIRPAFLGDELIIATWVAGQAAQTSPRKYRFIRARDGKTVAEAETLWVFCDTTRGRPIDITPEVCAAFPIVTDEEEIQAAIDAMVTVTTTAPAE